MMCKQKTEVCKGQRESAREEDGLRERERVLQMYSDVHRCAAFSPFPPTPRSLKFAAAVVA